MEEQRIERFILEFRYPPVVGLFDWRGELTEHLIKELNLDGFRITDQRIDVTIPESREFQAFVTLQNAGLVLDDSSLEDFNEKSGKYFEALRSFGKFSPREVARLGVKFSIFVHWKGHGFEKVRSLFESNVLKPDVSLFSTGNETLIDSGLPLHFRGEGYKFNLKVGPMHQNQALRDYFYNPRVYQELSGVPKKNIPKDGIFFDIDVFQENAGNIDLKRIEEKAQEFAALGHGKFDLLVKRLLDGQ